MCVVQYCYFRVFEKRNLANWQPWKHVDPEGFMILEWLRHGSGFSYTVFHHHPTFPDLALHLFLQIPTSCYVMYIFLQLPITVI